MIVNVLIDAFADFAREEAFIDKAYIVGGAVRDILLGKDLKDVDIVIGGDALDIAGRFAAKIGGTYVLLDEEFEVARVVKNAAFLDLAAMRGGSILSDLSERDMTINAMAMPIERVRTGESEAPPASSVIDPFGGRDDLRYGIIRMVSEGNLVQDPLRLLRLYRFASSLGFTIEIGTTQSVRKLAHLIAAVAGERIAEELRHILAVRFSYKTLREMERDGLLSALFPEIADLPKDILVHALRSYSYVEHILNNLTLYFPNEDGPVKSYFDEWNRLLCLKLSALFHKVHRPEEIIARLRMSRSEGDLTHKILTKTSLIETLDHPMGGALVKFLRAAGDDIYAVLILTIARHLICQCTDHPVLSFCRGLLTTYHREFIPRTKLLPILTGDDLIQEFQLKPSPRFKEILSTVEDMTLEGKISSRAEAMETVRTMLAERTG